MHQQSAWRAPSTATFLQPAQVAAIPQVSSTATIEPLAASPTWEVRAA
jgi:hypothetical protein